jgi:hypothetical protein
MPGVPPPPSWWTGDAAFLAFSTAWPCRPRLDAAAAGEAWRSVLMLRLVADYFARQPGRNPRRARDGGAST